MNRSKKTIATITALIVSILSGAAIVDFGLADTRSEVLALDTMPQISSKPNGYEASTNLLSGDPTLNRLDQSYDAYGSNSRASTTSDALQHIDDNAVTVPSNVPKPSTTHTTIKDHLPLDLFIASNPKNNPPLSDSHQSLNVNTANLSLNVYKNRLDDGMPYPHELAAQPDTGTQINVAEPTSIALMAIGLLIVGFSLRRK